MADFTKTISNSLNVFGLEQTTKWGTVVGGTGFWGYGTETTALGFEKNISESVTVSNSVAIEAGMFLTISNTVTLDSETTDQTLKESAGYSYVFLRPSLDADERNLSAFESVSRASTSWAATSATTSTSWSEQ